MYIQFKHGFIEADRWDGNTELPAEHLKAIEAVSHDAVIVVRSRERSTIEWAAWAGSPERQVASFRTPTWDYEFRCYLSASEWAAVLTAIAADLDYRNFKAWSGEHSTPARSRLAHGIWHEALVTRIAESTRPPTGPRRPSSR
jgi:hypothetical protein